MPAAVVIYTTLFDYSLFSDFIPYRGQWNFIPAYGTFGFGFYLLYSFSYILVSIILIEKFRRTTTANKEKRQALILLSALLFIVLVGPTLSLLLPIFGVYDLSVYTTNTIFVYIAAVYYAVFKLKFLNLTPLIMIDEIIANISDMIVILNTDLTVYSINEPWAKRMGRSQDSARGLYLNSFVSEDYDIDSIFNELHQSREKSINCRIHFKNDNEDVVTDSYISKIYDRFNDHTGYLIIARENRGKKQFQNDYNITNREFQIIDLVLSGLSNKIIAEKLGISERTVETHRLNVYAKIGISDRIELFKIAGEYNLVFNN
jgi:DNA-binding CsgD family transcriptional regulator